MNCREWAKRLLKKDVTLFAVGLSAVLLTIASGFILYRIFCDGLLSVIDVSFERSPRYGQTVPTGGLVFIFPALAVFLWWCFISEFKDKRAEKERFIRAVKTVKPKKRRRKK